MMKEAGLHKILKRYFFEIAYLGTQYSGWQRQVGVSTVQQTIEDSISKILDFEVRIHGCGRTDAGVHASQYFFHIDLEIDPEEMNLMYKLNRLLPKDICIHKIFPVDTCVNAQKSAISRTYHYHIHLFKNPFIDHVSYFELEGNLDVDSMTKAIVLLSGNHDFRYLTKAPNKLDNCICRIDEAELFYDERNSCIKITIRGNRFLHHMVRLIVGNVLKIGKGRMEVEEFAKILYLEKAPKHFELAHPQGLFLSKIEYAFGI